MALTNETFVARNALQAYLIVSAVGGSVTTRGALIRRKSDEILIAVDSSAAPMTILSGWRKSCTADPSRRNSGFEATVTSDRSSARSTTWVEPTGTVDLLTTIEPAGRCGPISLAACSMKLMSARPSLP